jgi:hypothetical protein
MKRGYKFVYEGSEWRVIDVEGDNVIAVSDGQPGSFLKEEVLSYKKSSKTRKVYVHFLGTRTVKSNKPLTVDQKVDCLCSRRVDFEAGVFDDIVDESEKAEVLEPNDSTIISDETEFLGEAQA